jgi:hypothetical protein
MICPSGRFVESAQQISFYAHGLYEKCLRLTPLDARYHVRQANHHSHTNVVACDKREAFTQGSACQRSENRGPGLNMPSYLLSAAVLGFSE